jgi:cystathionine beta-lyase/cystathionine gamma-synthase
MNIRTLCARGAGGAEALSRPVTPPIVASSTFTFDSQAGVEDYYEAGRGYHYSRYDNPTVRAAERFLADIEGGEEAVLFSSGMAAISTALLSLARTDRKRIAAQRCIYGGTAHVLSHVLPDLGIETDWIEQDELPGLSSRRLERASVLYLETPTNPALGVVDLRSAAEAARSAGAVSVVDSTFGTPVFQRPLEMGIDVVVHSATKYLGGHADLTAGAVVGRSAVVSAIAKLRRSLGGVLDPFQAFLLHRGMQTLPVRMEAHARGAEAVARSLEGHPRILRVLWPGLASHPDHELAKRQMSGFGGMVTVDLDGGEAAAFRLHDRVRLFARAASLGGVASLVSLPTRTSHRHLTDEERARAGVTPGMARLSIGLEAPEDLVEDLRSALA